MERIRVAQIMTFPCFQKQGVATLLLQTVNNVCGCLLPAFSVWLQAFDVAAHESILLCTAMWPCTAAHAYFLSTSF
jgi:hypothetical protein